MPGYEQAVFISYAWGGVREEFVNEIDNALQSRGIKIKRDKRELEYRGSIKEFMERIGHGDCVIVVISDKYLRSPNCMFELVEIAENKDFDGRVFPIILEDANIYDPMVQTDYLIHWDEKIKKLREKLAQTERGYTRGLDEQLNLFLRIRSKVDEITTILKDMNVLTPSVHQASGFNELYEAIIRRLGFLPISTEQSSVEEEDLDDWGKPKVNTSGLKNWLRSRFTGES